MSKSCPGVNVGILLKSECQNPAQKEKTLSTGKPNNPGDGIADGNEIKSFDCATKGKRVRKVLLFGENSNCSSSASETLKISRNKFVKKMPPRKSSLDMFELNSTSENSVSGNSETVVSLGCDSVTPTLSRLSGVSVQEVSEFEEEEATMSSNSPDDSQWAIFSQRIANDATLTPERNSLSLSSSVWLTPAEEPPSCAEVMLKLGELGLPEVVNEIPFYSEPADVAKSSEVGTTVLKLKSKSVAHLEEFEGTFNCLSKLIKSAKKLSAGSFLQTHLLLTPLRDPPSSAQAKEWLKTKLLIPEDKVMEHKKITKIVLPSSPGCSDKDDDSMSGSMTLSQCTPLSKPSSEVDVNVSFRSTPESTSNDSKISPLMASTPVNPGNQPGTSKKRFSRVSSAYKRSLPLIKEEEQDDQQNDLLKDTSPQGMDGEHEPKMLLKAVTFQNQLGLDIPGNKKLACSLSDAMNGGLQGCYATRKGILQTTCRRYHKDLSYTVVLFNGMQSELEQVLSTPPVQLIQAKERFRYCLSCLKIKARGKPKHEFLACLHIHELTVNELNKDIMKRIRKLMINPNKV
ncbi:DNA polymerase zeta catalytic subunit [Homalodisca vitripennis]|nr:DNA polymerase zeta catalytic subunit [Homalodisca vitripennis]